MRKVLYILGQMNDDDIEWMIANGTPRQLAPGDIAIHEGQPIETLYIVLEGALAVAAAASGNAVIAHLGAGEIIGEISLVDSRPPSATVSATQPSTLFAIDRARLYDKLERDPWFAARFYRAVSVFLADRLRNTVVQLGYGAAPRRASEMEYSGELDDGVLDNVHLAGARFERILKRFVGHEA
jgi:CRP/FNR family transcriptional regulator, cyclic AMP receptor protein